VKPLIEEAEAGVAGPKQARHNPRFKIPVEDFLEETSAAERELLRVQLGAALLHFLEEDRAVYLDAFGLLIPRTENEQQVSALGEKLVVNQTKIRKLYFEKSNELVPAHHASFARIVELRELSQWLQPRIAVLGWSSVETRYYLRAFVDWIKNETITNGISQGFAEIGRFLALHNRQGSDFNSWFAGSDIFLDSPYSKILSTCATRLFERPVLESPLELLESACGRPRSALEINLAAQLQFFGYEGARLEEELAEEDRKLTVFQFDHFEQPKGGQKKALYCSDGLRRLAYRVAGPHTLGCEAILQTMDDSSDAEVWIARIFTLAWILLQSTSGKVLKSGLGLSTHTAFESNAKTPFRAVLCTPFRKVSSEQVCKDGRFQFINLLAICDDEAKLLQASSAQHLLALLAHKALDQYTSLKRSSVLARSELPCLGRGSKA
jgi:hypothetical protein